MNLTNPNWVTATDFNWAIGAIAAVLVICLAYLCRIFSIVTENQEALCSLHKKLKDLTDETEAARLRKVLKQMSEILEQEPK